MGKVAALVTMYAGEAEILRDVTLPTFRRYADRHGFHLIEAEAGDGPAPHLGKVAALRSALKDHELAVWIDADAVIFDDAPDLSEWMPGAARSIFAQHRNLQYGINTWLWGVRRDPQADRFLDRVEQAASSFTEPPWDLRAVQMVLGEFPEHQLGMVVTPAAWQSPDGHFLHVGTDGGSPSYAERVRLCRRASMRYGAGQGH